MKKNSIVLLILALVLMLPKAGHPGDYEKFWPQWRGPLATGEAPHGNPPVKWDEKTNVRWKTAIPGKGLATPVIWGDQIFILTAVPTNKKLDPEKLKAMEAELPAWRRGRSRPADTIMEFVILSVSLKNGSLLWKKTLTEELPIEGTHRDGSWASNSPVTDGKYIYAYFGSYGLYCLDMKGKLIWKKDLGDMHTRHSFGEGSSPALYQDKLVINWDHEGDSFIIALDKSSGKTLWRQDRDEVTSWSTPLIVFHEGKPQVIVSASGAVRGYDLNTGRVIWQASGLTLNVIPTPVYNDGVVYVMSGFRGSALLAIKLAGAKGDLTGSGNILWTYNNDTPYTPSPLLYKGYLYFFEVNKENLTCLNAHTGKPAYGPQKLQGMKGVYASPVAAGDHVYIAGRNGVCYVLKPGPKYEVVRINVLEDGFDASPVVVGDNLILRGLKSLYCIGRK